MPLTREEIERRMDELARKYVEAHDHKIVEELYRLSCVSLRIEAPETQVSQVKRSCRCAGRVLTGDWLGPPLGNTYRQVGCRGGVPRYR